MNKLIPLSILTIALMSRCSYNPVADFTASTDVAEPYETIYFENNSSESTSYYWDFGDGQSSSEVNPDHFYSNEGTYTISLTAKQRRGGSDVAYLTIDVYYTQLEVTVAEWNSNYLLNNLISNASVTLYATYNDWLNLHNPIETQMTNINGVALFLHVEPAIYYIDVYHPYYNNFGIGQEDVSFIETLSLVKSMTNTFTAWVDYVQPSIQQQNRSIRIPCELKQEKRTYKRVEVVK
jgi:hypothetical protein